MPIPVQPWDNRVYGLVLTGLAAARPAFGIAGRWYIASDTLAISYDTGAAWVTVGTLRGHDLEALAASWVTSGRFGVTRLEWTLNKLLKGAGVGADPTEIDVPSAIKEFFVPVTAFYDGASFVPLDAIGTFPRAYCDNVGHYGLIAFQVPSDFTAITNAEIIVISGVTNAVANWDIYSNYGTIGESYNAHSENNTASTYNVTISKLFNVNIAGILSALAANDYVGVKLLQNSASDNVYILGVRFKYS